MCSIGEQFNSDTVVIPEGASVVGDSVGEEVVGDSVGASVVGVEVTGEVKVHN